jgi:hypothetical protein
MSEQRNPGGFTGDPAAALTVSGTGGCCGNPPRATDVLAADPAEAAAPCCGSAVEARVAGSCCGATARADAVAAGAGCCG